LHDAAKLVAIEKRLDEVRRKKMYAVAAVFVGGFFLVLVWGASGLDLTVGFTIWLAAGLGISMYINEYYDAEKAEIMQQLQKMASKSKS